MMQYQTSYTDNSLPHSFPQLLSKAAAEPYRSFDWYTYWFARAKLRIDPAFVTILKEGLIPEGSRVLDLGCGQGLLASSLLTALTLARNNCWPNEWSPPPTLHSLCGIDVLPLDIKRAQQVLGGQADFAVGDVCSADFGEADVIVILDVLHYISDEAQEDVLRRVKQALTPNGRLILRVGNSAGGIWFRASYVYDNLVYFLRAGKPGVFHCRTLENWVTLLNKFGFMVRPIPMSNGLKLANTLLLVTNSPT